LSQWDLGSTSFLANARLDPAKARSAHIIISTPEKWDSSSRKFSTTHKFVKDVSVIIIDEVHLLDSDGRGGVLEALITRMKRIRDNKVRIVALSATMPNVREVAQWIGATEERTFAFEIRTAQFPLKADVFGYNPGKNKFVDKYIRLYKAVSLIEPHLAGGQALIFVATRSDTTQAASKLVEISAQKRRTCNTRVRTSGEHGSRTNPSETPVRNGIGFHPRGLVKARQGPCLRRLSKPDTSRYLISTSTLRLGREPTCTCCRYSRHRE